MVQIVPSEQHFSCTVSKNQMLVRFLGNFEQLLGMSGGRAKGRVAVGRIFSYHLILLSGHPALSFKVCSLLWGNVEKSLLRRCPASLRQMVGEDLTDLESKVSSAEANFSTSESTHSRPHNIDTPTFPPAPQRKTPQLHLPPLPHPQIDSQQHIEYSEEASRLFTFMDERDTERRIIQDFLMMNCGKGHRMSLDPQMDRQGGQQAEIVKIIEDSRKKREDFLKKLGGNCLNLKEDKSTSKLNRANKSKTPKHLPNHKERYETIEPRSRSKTPKFDNNRSITPRYDRELKMFRAKSSLEKEFKKCQLVPKNEAKQPNKDTIQLKLEMSEQKQNETTTERSSLNSARALLKKKKELEKQLLAINESLLYCKKKPPQAPNKPKLVLSSKPSEKKHRKKSMVKLTRAS